MVVRDTNYRKNIHLSRDFWSFLGVKELEKVLVCKCVLVRFR